MAKNKTVFTDQDVVDFIEKVENEQKRIDSYHFIELMKKVSGQEPKMWGPSIIGFGQYHYKYESGHEGDAPILGFSPRKAAFSLYVFSGLKEHEHYLENLGKFTMGKACIYVKKITDINIEVLNKLMEEMIVFTSEKYDRIS